MDEVLAASVRAGWRSGPLEERDRVMLDYVETVTLRPASCTREDVERLRAVGFDDTAILQVNLIASFFNYFNRVADGLGVGRMCPEQRALTAPKSASEAQS